MIWQRLGRNPHEDNKNSVADLDKLPMPTVENLKPIKDYVFFLLKFSHFDYCFSLKVIVNG